MTSRMATSSKPPLPSSPLPSSQRTRLVAARAVEEVLREKTNLETALSGQADYGALEGRDRAFARMIAATYFRRRGQIDAALEPYVKKRPLPFADAVLRTGAAQLLYLDTPPHAAVGETVAVLKAFRKTQNYAGMVNAVLRRVSENGKALAGAVSPQANIPQWIRTAWERAYGRAAMRKMALQLIQDPPLDVSFNLRGVAAEDVEAWLDNWAERLGGTRLPTQSVRLPRIGDVTQLPGFDEGLWWVQDIAASLPVKWLGDVRGKKVLDICAAPGGKTLQLAAAGAQVVALDRSEVRLQRLQENLVRTSLTADMITADALTWEAPSGPESFDHVILDAPCSATGTFRRHPEVLVNKSYQDVGSLSGLQAKFLSRAATHVRPGGSLIFCTCSLQPQEGEAQISAFLQKRPDFSLNQGLIPPSFKALELDDSTDMIRTLPHYLGAQGGMDGFFIAQLIRQ